jgi:hypothetical protein
VIAGSNEQIKYVVLAIAASYVGHTKSNEQQFFIN